MVQHIFRKTLGPTLLAAALCLAVPIADVQAKQAKAAPAQSQKTLSPAQAAQRAKAKHGGKVLKVTPKGKGYKVKLLTDSGRVMTVTVKD